MSDFDDNDKLTIVEKRDLVLQAGIQAIPHVGGSLATVIFGAKLERRLKRIDEFLKELAQEMEGLKDPFASIDEHDREALSAIMEELFEKVECEQVEEKRGFLKRYFKNTLIDPVKEDNYDERRFFLEALSSMTLLECGILGFLYGRSESIGIQSILIPEVDQYAVFGAVGRLRTYGLLVLDQVGINVGGVTVHNELADSVKLSTFGRRFHDFCLGK